MTGEYVFTDKLTYLVMDLLHMAATGRTDVQYIFYFSHTQPTHIFPLMTTTQNQFRAVGYCIQKVLFAKLKNNHCFFIKLIGRIVKKTLSLKNKLQL